MVAMRPWIWLSLVLSLVAISNSAKILVVVPFPLRSHNLLGNVYVSELIKAGHEVTYATPYPSNKSHPKLREIDISSVISVFPANQISIKNIMAGEMAPLFGQFHTLYTLTQATLKDKNFMKILEDPNEHFDLVIAEWMNSEIYAGLSAVFNCPYIWTVTQDIHWLVLRLMDEIPNPAYSVDFRNTHTAPLNFFERVHELYSFASLAGIYWLKEKIADEPAYYEIFEPLMEKRGRPLPPYRQVINNASLLLANGHVSLGPATKLPASVKTIGGYHIDETVPALPKDLQRIMDEATDGVIYFGMGTNLRSSEFPQNIKDGLLKVFGKLNQTVLWKYEADLPDRPKNVHVLKWSPQRSIVAHPNCRLFISHGGLLSLFEAIHHAVPVIGIPAYADQPVNVHFAVEKGFAIKVELGDNLVEDLEMAIREILTNSSYKENAKLRSLIYHHRPAPPRKEMVNWIEEVIMTGGAPHLRSAAIDTAWYQKLYLDLIFLLIIIYYSLKFLLKLIFRDNSQNLKIKQH